VSVNVSSADGLKETFRVVLKVPSMELFMVSNAVPMAPAATVRLVAFSATVAFALVLAAVRL
jgi:hypothetical protein